MSQINWAFEGRHTPEDSTVTHHPRGVLKTESDYDNTKRSYKCTVLPGINNQAE
jgi:hypothetical protein